MVDVSIFVYQPAHLDEPVHAQQVTGSLLTGDHAKLVSSLLPEYQEDKKIWVCRSVHEPHLRDPMFGMLIHVQETKNFFLVSTVVVDFIRRR